MKTKFALLLLPAFGAACFAQEDSAPRNELAFGLGGIPALSRSDSPSLDAGSGVAFQVNYGRRFNGQPNLASRELARGVFDFGAGLDVRIWRSLALRGEARDYYTGSPDYNVATISGGQQNIAATGGFVLRWH
jgi:hypothetical protein